MDISVDNITLAAEFFTGDLTKFNSKDDDYKNLFLAYASDVNSSSIRESVTLHLLGYEENSAKHGYDGIDKITGRLKEVKPRSIKSGNKVGNSGNFNDMTLDLLAQKSEYDVVCSLFTETKLIYIVEFPFKAIHEQIKKPIDNAKPGKRVVCHFSYTNYDCDDLIVHYFDPVAAKEADCLSKNHFTLLEQRLNKII